MFPNSAWALSEAQISRLQGHPVDNGGRPDFVPDQGLPPQMQALANMLNMMLFAFAAQELAAAGPGAQISLGDPFTITKP